jgi:hypothetical protein
MKIDEKISDEQIKEDLNEESNSSSYESIVFSQSSNDQSES